MGHPKKNFTIPVVCNYDGDLKKKWFVYFRFFHNGKWHVFKKKEGLNLCKTLKERTTEAEQLRLAREKWLKEGWNPVLEPKVFNNRFGAASNDLLDLKAMSFEKALQYALEKKQLAHKSKQDYGTTVRYVVKAAQKLNVAQMAIAQLSRVHCKALIKEAMQIKDWSNKAYNKNLTFFKSLLSELVEWDVLEYNPAFQIKNLATEDTQKFVPLTIEEKNIVREYLKKEHPAFLLFVTIIYATGIRPKEVLGLQIKDFNEADACFHLLPFSEKTKTKKQRKVAINPHLLEVIKKLSLKKRNPDHFIFSEGFKPGPVRIERKIATDLWDTLVRNHLGIDKYMYSVKHLGADDLIDAGKENGIQNIEEIVQQHLGHSSKFMTRRYTQKGLELSREVVARIAPKF